LGKENALEESNSTRLEQLIGMYKTSMNLELQARSFEFLGVLSEPAKKKAQILKPMPVPNEQDLKRFRDRAGKEAGSSTGEFSMSMSTKADAGAAGEINLLGDDDVAPSATTAAPTRPAVQAQKSLIDLDDLFGGGGAVPAAPMPAMMGMPPSPQPVASGGGGGNLMDLFGGGGNAPAAQTGGGMVDLFGGMQAVSTPPPQPPVTLSATIFNEGPLRIVMTLNSPATAPGSVTATAQFFNQGYEPLTDVVLQVAVPKYITVKLAPASGNTLAPGSAPQITQLMEFTNSLGDKPYMMKLKVSYTSPAGPVVAQAVVNDFPK
jgi:AP-1 complex subunit gamma-1